MFMIFINEVIKKCLFIQFKCHNVEFVVRNLLSINMPGWWSFLRNTRPSHSSAQQTRVDNEALRGMFLGIGSVFRKDEPGMVSPQETCRPAGEKAHTADVDAEAGCAWTFEQQAAAANASMRLWVPGCGLSPCVHLPKVPHWALGECRGRWK